LKTQNTLSTAIKALAERTYYTPYPEILRLMPKMQMQKQKLGLALL